MSLYALGQGFNQGVETGIDLGEAWVTGHGKRGIREANEIYAEMEAMIPGAPGTKGVPDGTESEMGGDGTGYTGSEWETRKKAYLKALGKSSSTQEIESMENRLVELEKSKIMDNGRMALAAIKSGDMATAQRYIGNISYYTDPGVAPQVAVDGSGNAFLQTPEGTTTLTPSNLEGYLHQLDDFGGWRQLTFDQTRHKDNMDHKRNMLAAEVASQTLRDDAYVRNTDSQIASRLLDNDLRDAQITNAIDANRRANELQASGLDEKARKELDDSNTNMGVEFEKIFAVPGPSEHSGKPAKTPSVSDQVEDFTAKQFAAEEGIPLIEDGGMTPVQADTANLAQATDLMSAMTESVAVEQLMQMQADPQMRQYAYAMMAGVRAADPHKEKYSDAQVAQLAYTTLFDRDGLADYLPDQGMIRTGRPGSYDYIHVADSHKPQLDALWGVQPGGGIPETEENAP